MNQLERLLQKKRAERDKLDYLIQEIERELGVQDSKQRAGGTRKRGTSVASLAEKVLEAHPVGLKVPALIAELGKLGFKTESKNPTNNVNSILHRTGSPFVRLDDGRWILEKHASHPESNGTVAEQTKYGRAD
jgi:HB1, ASXL, restriction endonuclease HTH domain